jgi:hypothetical protein
LEFLIYEQKKQQQQTQKSGIRGRRNGFRKKQKKKANAKIGIQE